MSFCEQIRHAVMASPRVELPKMSALLWKAFAADQVTEAEASELSELIEARKIIPGSKPAPRRTGSRPRSPASLERRRTWAASGRIPPRIAARFSMGEQAALAVVGMEIQQHGACRLAIDHIAALAGVGRSTVKRALREAHALGLIRIEERRLTGFRNDTNIVTIMSPEWLSWLRFRPRGEGSNLRPASNTRDSRQPTNETLYQSRIGFRATGGQPVQAKPLHHGSERPDTR